MPQGLILVAAALVIAAGIFRGGRLIRTDLPPSITVTRNPRLDPEHKLRIALDGLDDDELLSELCERHRVTESDFYLWRDQALAGATDALAAQPGVGA